VNGLSPQVRRTIWSLIAAGTVLRLVLAFTTDGQPYDIQVLGELRGLLDSAPLDVYVTHIGPGGATVWPYPPGYFPFAALAGVASDVSGLGYSSLVRIPSILADAAIALIVQDFLGRRGAAAGARMAATALVAIGPTFALISGYHGQIDSLAILPAVAAVAIWERAPEGRRALYAGLLIGLGAAVKTTPIFMLLALLPAVRSWREAATLVGAAVAVPVAALSPWLVNTPHDVVEALRYRGFPGTSPLSILLQPDQSEQLNHLVNANGAVQFIFDRGQIIVAVALAAVAAWSARFRRQWQPADRAVLIWIAFYIVAPTFFFQYLVWGLPFFILAGRLRLALAVQLMAVIPEFLFYGAPWESTAVAVPYAITMLALWALFAFSFARIARERRRSAALA
jgi:hypothetical protein